MIVEIPSLTSVGYQLDWQDTLMGTLQMSIEELREGYVRGRMPVGNFNRQPGGVLHGGAITALAESLTSLATATMIDLTTESCFGQETNTSLLRTIPDGYVEAVCEAIHRGRSACIWDVRCYDPEGKLAAICRCTIAIRPRRAGKKG